MGCTKQGDGHPRHHIMNLGPDGIWYPIFWHFDCHALTGCQVCKDALVQHDGKHGDELLQSILATPPLQPHEVHAAAVAGGPADPTSAQHDPAELAKLPTAVQQVLVDNAAPQSAPVAAPVASDQAVQ